MRTLEFTGRTVDEAIFHGLNEMGVTIDQVDIVTVQSETKGLFGIGARNAIVRLTEREVPVIPDFDALNEERREQREAEKVDHKSFDRRPQKRDRNEGKRSGKRDNNRRSDRSEHTEPRITKPAYDYSLETAQDCDAAVFLQELLGKMQLNGTVKAFINDEGVFLNIESDTDGLLIGRRGDTLDALQYITSLYLNKGHKDSNYIRVSVDTEGYRARREESLRKLARSKALQVSRTGRPIEMEPMNPYERRILHSALQDFRGVTTHSEGEEPNRHVVIVPDED